jgi:WD40 repeat protein
MSRFLALAVCGLVLSPPAFAQEAEGRVRLVREPGGHAAEPWALAFTPDGKKLVSVADDHTVQVWDVAARERLFVIRPPVGVDGLGGPMRNDVGRQLVIDPKGEHVAFCVAAREDKDSVVKTTFVCGLDTGEAKVLKRSGARAFAPDGKSLAVGEGREVQVVDIDTDKASLTTTLPEAQAKYAIINLAYSPDGKHLAVITSGAKVHVLDAATLKLRHTWTVPGSGHNLRTLGWANDHALVFRSFAREQALVVLDAGTGEVKHSFALAKLLEPLPKGTEPRLIEIDALTGTTKAFVRTRIKVPSGRSVDLCYLLDWSTGQADKGFSQDSPFGCGASAVAADQSIAAQGDGSNNMILLWDPATGQALRDGKRVRVLRPTVLGAHGWYNCIRWRPDGKAVSWERLGQLGSFDELGLTTLTLTRKATRDLQAYDKENAHTFVGDEERSKWNRDYHVAERGITRKSGALVLGEKDNAPLVTGAGPEPIRAKGSGGVCQWDLTFAEGDRVITHGWGNSMLQVYDTKGQLLQGTRPTHSYIQAIAVSPRPLGRYLLLGSADQTLTIFDPAAGRVLLTVFPTGADWIAWTPEGYYAATPGGERLMGWHVESGPDRLAEFYPAERFRKRLFRPDVIKLVLEKGSVAEALKAANAALPVAQRPASDGVADVAKMLPPAAVLKLVSRNDRGAVRLAATVEGGAGSVPVRSLRLMVDGRPAAGDGFVLSFDKGPPAGEVAWPELELPPGRHRVVVLVRGPDSSSVSNALEIDTRPATERPTLHVLAVGVSKYRDRSLDLDCAAADARLLADTLVKQCKGGVFGDVRAAVLLDDKATGEAIRAAVRHLHTASDARVKANDLVIVFFAGHGAKEPEKDQFYLLPHDAQVDGLAKTGLSGKELADELKSLGSQVLLILDACHSAGFGEKGKLSAQGLRPATDDATRTLSDDDVGVAVMCAAMGNEKAQERDGNGLFTRALVEALTARDAPYNRANHRQYVHHLQGYVFDKVMADSDDKQHPFLHLPWVVQSFALRDVPGR